MNALSTAHELELLYKMYGAIIPNAGWAIVKGNRLCHTRAGHAHLYAAEDQAHGALALLTDDERSQYAVVAVMTVDQTRLAEVAL